MRLFTTEPQQSLERQFRLELSLQQRMEMRVELADRVGERVQELFRGGPTAPVKQYNLMIVRVMELVTAMTAKDLGYAAAKDFSRGIAERLFAPAIRAESLAQPETLAVKRTPDEILSFVIDCLWRELQEGEGQDGLPSAAGTKAEFRSLMLSPEQLLLSRVAGRDSFPEDDDWSSAARVTSIIGNRRALELRRAVFPVLKNLSQIIYGFAMNARDAGGEHPYQEFFRDLVVHDHLTFLISDRIIESFSRRLDSLHRAQDLSPDCFRRVMLRAIGEFVVASLGMVTEENARAVQEHPRIERVPVEWRDGVWNEHAQRLNRIVSDPAVQRWREAGGRAILPFGLPSSQCWVTLDGAESASPGARRGEYSKGALRSFLRQTVRADADALLDRASEANLYARCKAALDRFYDRQTRAACLGEALVESLESHAFQDFIRERLHSDSWYAALDALVRF